MVLYSIVLSSMMLFKRSVGLTRSLFIVYVHEHDRVGFWMLTVETAVIHLMFILIVPIATEKVSRIRSNIIWKGKIHMSEPASGKGNVNTVEFVNQARGDTRVSRTAEFVYDE